MKDKIIEIIECKRDEYYSLSRYIWENPELGNKEYKAVEALTKKLASEGFEIEKNVANLETGFIASYKSDKDGPTMAFLGEYDALPQLGHGCGHNMIGVAAALCAVSLKEVVDTFGGRVLVLGTPAEETYGGKVKMVEAGIFDDVDAALMIHPSRDYISSGTSLAMEALQFDFYGKPAHGAASPHKGVNALDALVNFYVAVSTLRQQLTSDVRIHGIISKGGDAANIIPDHTQGQFYIRAMKKEYLQEVIEKVKKCAEGAALMTGCTLEISNYEETYDNLITNQPLSQLYTQNLIAVGITIDQIQEKTSHGSSDIGNVSQVVPAIHPYTKICASDIAGHTKEFRDAAGSEEGFDQMLYGIKAMALTGFDLLTDEEKLKEVKGS